jgi:hypothetical protein
MCNDPKRSQFTETRKAEHNEVIFAGKTCYKIEAFGTTILNVDTPSGLRQMTLLNVALVPDFITNLVSLSILNKKDVH